MYDNSIGRKHIGCDLGECLAVVTAIISDGHLDRLIREGLSQIVRKSLRSRSYRVLIDAIGSNPHDAPKTPCAEFKTLVEAVNELTRIRLFKQDLNLILRL